MQCYCEQLFLSSHNCSLIAILLHVHWDFKFTVGLRLGAEEILFTDFKSLATELKKHNWEAQSPTETDDHPMNGDSPNDSAHEDLARSNQDLILNKICKEFILSTRASVSLAVPKLPFKLRRIKWIHSNNAMERMICLSETSIKYSILNNSEKSEICSILLSVLEMSTWLNSTVIPWTLQVLLQQCPNNLFE